MRCDLCGFETPDREWMGVHLATEHPAEWEMAIAISVVEVTDGGQL